MPDFLLEANSAAIWTRAFISHLSDTIILFQVHIYDLYINKYNPVCVQAVVPKKKVMNDRNTELSWKAWEHADLFTPSQYIGLIYNRRSPIIDIFYLLWSTFRRAWTTSVSTRPTPSSSWGTVVDIFRFLIVALWWSWYTLLWWRWSSCRW